MAAAVSCCIGLPSRVAVGNEPAHFRRHSPLSFQVTQGALHFDHVLKTLADIICCRMALRACGSRCFIFRILQRFHVRSPPLTLLQVSGVLVAVLVTSRSFGTRINAMEVPLVFMHGVVLSCIHGDLSA